MGESAAAAAPQPDPATVSLAANAFGLTPLLLNHVPLRGTGTEQRGRTMITCGYGRSALMVLALAAIGSQAAIGCGTAHRRVSRTAEGHGPEAQVPMADLTSGRLQAAVTDGRRGLIVEGGPSGVVGATLVDAGGRLSTLPGLLPPVHRPALHGLRDGFVLTGYRCDGRQGVNLEASDDDLLCATDEDPTTPRTASPVVAGLNSNGIVDWTVTGPKVRPSKIGLSFPTPDGVLMQVGGSFYLVDQDGFERLDPPSEGPGDFTPCWLRDGGLAAMVTTYADPGDDAAGGSRRFFLRRGGGWSRVGDPVKVEPGDLVVPYCTVGGIVTQSSVIVSPQPVEVDLRDVSLDAIRGVGRGGSLLVDGRPRRLLSADGRRSVRAFDSARAVALSADGNEVISIADSVDVEAVR
jgi:hypothetical protein